MRIATWNTLNRNTYPQNIMRFIEVSDADIICFQELHPVHIEAIRATYGDSLFVARDCLDKGELCHLGIYSKHPSVLEGISAINTTAALSPSYIGRKEKWQECLDAISVRVTLNGAQLVICNIHLTCAAPPSYRYEELSKIIQGIPAGDKTILCGDFNTFARPFINFLIGPLYGYKIGDYLTKEIPHMRKLLGGNNFSLVENAQKTFADNKYVSLILDHFAVKDVAPTSLTINQDTFGSDHYPVIMDFEY